MPAFLQPDLQQILSQAISFLLLWFLLKKFAWKPLLGILDARREQIKAEFDRNEQTRAELATLQQEYAKRLSAIEDEARAKLQESIKEGKRISAEVQEQARLQASAILEKSREAVEMELAKAKVVLRDQVADMTVDALERVLQRKLDPQADRRLVEAALDELERHPAGR